MKLALATLALGATLSHAGMAMASDASPGHMAYLASVATYKPMQGFNHIVGPKRFVGYFLQKPNVCAVTVMVALADDERLATPPQRVQIEIPAANRSEVLAGNGDALGIACTVDADAIKVVPLLARPTKAASK
jgi:hypothetical protein